MKECVGGPFDFFDLVGEEGNWIALMINLHRTFTVKKWRIKMGRSGRRTLGPRLIEFLMTINCRSAGDRGRVLLNVGRMEIHLWRNVVAINYCRWQSERERERTGERLSLVPRLAFRGRS